MRWSSFFRCSLLCGLALACLPAARAQKAWFADGFHGGIYGHYPPTFTQFMIDSLQQHPEWKLNIEIEPETWDFARTNTPEAYQAFKSLADTASNERRIEFVNPAYGQSYLWNISGESVIQQFARGLRKIHEHFPNAPVVTYCTEEPCFTSALPGILRSFGFKYAVLKNPNTCWGGYTRAHGGERVNWVGSDGTGVPTVPRYEIEALKPGSTWETIGNMNTPTYIDAARDSGVAHPIGMCLQDAGWRFGPWLNHDPHAVKPSEYVTWQHYFEKVLPPQPGPDWRFSQEDIQVSLVWGSQVLQRIAGQVRSAESQLVMAQKLATLAAVYENAAWPGSELDEAWRTLLLSQHHDCWIVPYNGRRGNTWADKVRDWTDGTRETCKAIENQAMQKLSDHPDATGPYSVRVFNTIGSARTSVIGFDLPEALADSASVWDPHGKQLASQLVNSEGRRQLLFAAPTPSLGFNTFWLKEASSKSVRGANAVRLSDGVVRVETDFYLAELDPRQGGTFRSLVAKKLGKKELVKQNGPRRMNEIRGFFFQNQRFESSVESPCEIKITEQGPLRVRLQIDSQVASNRVTHTITFIQGEPRIDFALAIDWQGSPGIGADYRQSESSRREDDRKAFYDDRFKLLALFPLNLRSEKIFKDAPFDVTESGLTNTFFETWSGIKNNVLLHWADLYDPAERMGVALLTDHTTSYVHGPDHPLALTLQYRGSGLWGRDYSIQGPTTVNYALLPHAGDWQAADLWTAASSWNEPLLLQVCRGISKDGAEKSLITIDGGRWEIVTARVEDGRSLVRLFNPSTSTETRSLHYGSPLSKVDLVQLNGQLLKSLPVKSEGRGGNLFELTLPAMGLATLELSPSSRAGQ